MIPMLEIDKDTYRQLQDREGKLEFNVHDDRLLDLRMDYLKQTVVLSCEKTFPQAQRYDIICRNVIGMYCTGGNFWGGKDYVFYDMKVESDAQKNRSFLTAIEALEKAPEKYTAMEDYIQIWFGLLSGDTISIVCKKMITSSCIMHRITCNAVDEQPKTDN